MSSFVTAFALVRAAVAGRGVIMGFDRPPISYGINPILRLTFASGISHVLLYVVCTFNPTVLLTFYPKGFWVLFYHFVSECFAVYLKAQARVADTLGSRLVACTQRRLDGPVCGALLCAL